MEDLQNIFKKLKPLLEVYQPALVSKMDDNAHFDLWTTKETLIHGRKFNEVYFAAIALNKAYVTFYYMPIYAEPETRKYLKPELLSRLKGKSCFHINKLDDVLFEQIKEALERGYKEYQKRGWV
jgi:hypothetical protein